MALALVLLPAGCLGEAAETLDDFRMTYEELRADMKPQNPNREELNEAEQALDARLEAMKQAADDLYSNEEDYGTVTRINEKVLSSDLYRFCEALPKGGELHSHGVTAVSFDRFLSAIRDSASICLEEGDTYGNLYPLNSEKAPEGCVPLAQALEEGRLTENDLYDMLVMWGDEGWNGYRRASDRVSPLKADEELKIRLIEAQYLSCIENGMILLEIRLTFTADDSRNLASVAPYIQAYYNVKKEHPDFMVRFIACSGKRRGREDALETMRAAIRQSKTLMDESDPENPKPFIIGLDLVNEEDSTRPLSEFDFFLTDEFQNCGLVFTFHCGESLRMDNESIIDAFLYGASRLGHGLNLYRFPFLMETAAKCHVAVEVCPLSNHRLGFVYDLRLHPALTMISNGVPVTICSDDGMYLTLNPQVDDFFAAILCWDLTLGDIKAICRNSLTYSCLPQEDIDRMIGIWEAQWDAFVQGF